MQLYGRLPGQERRVEKVVLRHEHLGNVFLGPGRSMHPTVQLIAGALAADALAAFFHFFEDNYLPNTDKPGILGDVARDNELHHALPFSMVTPPVVVNVRASGIITLVISAILLVTFPAFVISHPVFMVSMMVVGTLSNVVHRWQHERDCTRPWVVTALQNAGILVGRDQHAEHHEDPSRRYGVALGFTNVVYDGLHVWDVLRALIPLTPHPKPGVHAYAPIVPQEIRRELTKPCPRKLGTDEVDMVRRALELQVQR